MSSLRINILLCVVVMLLVFGAVTEARAQAGADHGLAQRDGLGQKDLDESKLPGALEYAIVIGSVIAAIGVVKFV